MLLEPLVFSHVQKYIPKVLKLCQNNTTSATNLTPGKKIGWTTGQKAAAKGMVKTCYINCKMLETVTIESYTRTTTSHLISSTTRYWKLNSNFYLAASTQNQSNSFRHHTDIWPLPFGIILQKTLVSETNTTSFKMNVRKASQKQQNQQTYRVKVDKWLVTRLSTGSWAMSIRTTSRWRSVSGSNPCA